jgi:hypothetical protein
VRRVSPDGISSEAKEPRQTRTEKTRKGAVKSNIETPARLCPFSSPLVYPLLLLGRLFYLDFWQWRLLVNDPGRVCLFYFGRIELLNRVRAFLHVDASLEVSPIGN